MKKQVLLLIGLTGWLGPLQANDSRSENQSGNAVILQDESLYAIPSTSMMADSLSIGSGDSISSTLLSPMESLFEPYVLDQPLDLQHLSSKKADKQKKTELPVDSIRVRKRERGLISMSNMFVPQGQWVIGVNAAFSAHSNDHYTFVVIEGIDSKGYTVDVSPFLGYAFRNNMVIGARFMYSRTFQSIDSGSLKLGDEETGIDLTVDHYYGIKYTYQASLAWRQYIPLGRSKRFALYNEMQLAIGNSQSKFAEGSPVRGTYETGRHYLLGITPGLVAFATNNMAIELNVGIMGITYSKVRQIHNQVTVGTRKSSMMNFKVNIFSIGIGVAFYL